MRSAAPRRHAADGPDSRPGRLRGLLVCWFAVLLVDDLGFGDVVVSGLRGTGGEGAFALELSRLDGVSPQTSRKRRGLRNLQTTLRYAEQSDITADNELRARQRRRRWATGSPTPGRSEDIGANMQQPLTAHLR